MLLIIYKKQQNYFTGRQGLAFRGNWIAEDGAETNSNFYQIMKFCTKNKSEWLKSRDYSSPKIQNELIFRYVVLYEIYKVRRR